MLGHGRRRTDRLSAWGRPWLGPAVLLAALAVLLEQVLLGGPVQVLDEVVARWTADHQHGPVTGPVIGAAKLLAELAQPMLVVPLFALAAAGWGWWRRTWRPPLLALTGTTALAVALALKTVVARGGPDGQIARDGGAWPSGHVTTAVVAWGLAAQVLPPSWRAARTLLQAVPGPVGAAMILSDYHWLSDVLAGWLLGPLLLATVTALVDRATGNPDSPGTGRSAGRLGVLHCVGDRVEREGRCEASRTAQRPSSCDATPARWKTRCWRRCGASGDRRRSATSTTPSATASWLTRRC